MSNFTVRERTHELIELNDNIRSECSDIEDSIFQEEFISIVMNNIYAKKIIK